MPSTVKSMRDILNSVIADNQKLSAEDVNPPTAGPGAGSPDNEQPAVEGQRSRENEQAMKDLLGDVNPEVAPSPDTHTGEYDQAYRAAKLAPAGEDPASQKRDTGLPSATAEPGTSAPGLSLGDKVSAWTDSAADLLVEYCIEHKVSTESLPPELKREPAASTKQADASQKQADAPADTDEPVTDSDDPYLTIANGNAKEAQVAYEIVHGQLAEAHLAGKMAAEMTIRYLHDLQSQASKAADVSAPATKAAATRPVVTPKLAMGMPPGMEGGGPPPPPPGMEGGEGLPPGAEGGGEMGEDPADVEQALVELAQEMGVSPEELVQMLQAEMEGGGDAGGPPPPPEVMPPDAGGMEGKVAIEERIKKAAAINSVKKNALEILLEKTRRGQR